jgi:hypothetical protein
MYFAFFTFIVRSGHLNSCVHPGYAEAGCNCFSQSNKTSFIEKKKKFAADAGSLPPLE